MEARLRSSLRWAYILILLPLATERFERGRSPSGARDWMTEAVMGAVVFELEPEESLAAFYRRADGAMYAIKKSR